MAINYSFYVVIVLGFLCLFYKWLSTTHAANKNKPPSPPKLPIIGNLHQLGRLPHRSLQSLAKQYGELMLIHIGSKPTLVVSSAYAARETMKTHDVVFANRPKSKVACKVVYDSKDLVFANYGEYWRQMKCLCMLHVFSNTKVRSFRGVREEEAAAMVGKIKRLSGLSEEVNLSKVLASLTNDVICRTAFGRKYTGEEGCADISEILGDFSQVHGVLCYEDYIPWLGLIDRISGVDRKTNEIAKGLDEFIEKIVQEHQDRPCSYKADKEEVLQNFVEILLKVQKESPDALLRENIKAILLDMLTAGTETTYALLEWAMTELLRHPRVMNKLQSEVRGRTRGKTGVDEDDLTDLKYLKAVIKETLRLHPPLPLLLFHRSSQDVKINRYDIVAGTHVIINAWAIQRDSAYWNKPEEFYPERFLNCSVDFKGQDFEFIPFGAGRRGCPGIAFGILEAELTLATLVYEFNWKLPEGQNFNLAERAGTIIRKQDPLVAIPLPIQAS